MHQGETFCTEYEKSKVLADKIALQAAAEGVPITIVYPGVIYGPGKLTTGNLVSRIVWETSYHEMSYSLFIVYWTYWCMILTTRYPDK